MPLYGNADVVVLHGRWLDEATGVGVRDPDGQPATVTLDPVALGASSGTPNLRNLAERGWLKTRRRVGVVDDLTGYFAVLAVASNDPDLDAYAGRRVTFTGEEPFTVEVPWTAPYVPADSDMVAALGDDLPGLQVGDLLRALPLTEAALAGVPTPTPAAAYLTSVQTLATIVTGLEVGIDAHEADDQAHPQLRAALSAELSGQIEQGVAQGLASRLEVARNLDDLPDPALARGNLGLAEVASSGSAADITSGVFDDERIPDGVARDVEVATAVADRAPQAELDAHTADRDNPHEVTAEQVGLGQVANLPPAGLPVSSATAQAIAEASTADRDRENHRGMQGPDTIRGLVTAVRKIVRDQLAPGANVSIVVHPDTLGVTISASGGGGGSGGGDLDPEAVRDIVAATYREGANISVLVGDPPGTTTIAVTGLAPVALSGSYTDLSGQPALHSVALSGSYADLSGTPAIPGTYEDLSGLVPPSALPGIAITTWLGEVASESAMLALLGERGDWATRTDLGTDWILIAEPSSARSSWRERTTPQSPVTSVNGRTGSVTGLAEQTDLTGHTGRTDNPHGVTKAQVGLGQVDNTPDTAKPVSAAQQAAIETRVPNTRQVIAGTGLAGGGGLDGHVTLTVRYGSASGTAVQGNDTRIVNAVQASQRGPLGGVVAIASPAAGATVTPDGTLGFQFAVTASTGGFTLAAGSGLAVGQGYLVVVTASGGDRVVTYGAGVTPTVSVTQTASAVAASATSYTVPAGKTAFFLLRAKTATTATLLAVDREA